MLTKISRGYVIMHRFMHSLGAKLYDGNICGNAKQKSKTSLVNYVIFFSIKTNTDTSSAICNEYDIGYQ